MKFLNIANVLSKILVVSSVGLLSLGCDKEGTAEANTVEQVTQEESAPASETVAAKSSAEPSSDKVSVAKEGTRFDPPVPVASIPDGAWMCDMNGKVHYAALRKKDGKCPVCSMKLVEKGAHGKMQGGDHGDMHGEGHEGHMAHE